MTDEREMRDNDTTLLTRAQVRDVDRRAIEKFSMTGLVLMENAGRGCVDVLEQIGIEGSIVILCGRGNNAGDGFVIARHLRIRGFSVKVLLFSPSSDLRGDALANFQILSKTDVSIVELKEAEISTGLKREFSSCRDQGVDQGVDWVVDAMLGTGASGPVRSPLDQVIEIANRVEAKKMALDLPSGLDCDLGQTEGPAFCADHTCTFVAKKPGLLTQTGTRLSGTIHVLDIGAPPEIVREILDERVE